MKRRFKTRAQYQAIINGRRRWRRAQVEKWLEAG
jgi:hypothetical protein